MKLIILFLFLFQSLFTFSQTNRCNQTNFEYSNCQKLELNFDSIGSSIGKIHWKKFEKLESVEIYGYTSSSSQLKGFNKGNFKNLAINYSDVVSFFSKNQIPNSVTKLTIWLSETYGDTLSVPKEISSLINLKYLSIGCCANLNFEHCDLSNLSTLDTLIVEAPVSNLHFLKDLNHLSYIGFWSPQFEESKLELDSLLPNTEKEAWCFPGNQEIHLWNGQIKTINHLQVGDTIISYDFKTQKIFPSIIEELELHSCANYMFGTLGKNELIASTAELSIYPICSNVQATVNHPVPTSEGIIPFGSIKFGNTGYFLGLNGKVETRITEPIRFEIRKEVVYNIKTSTNNYFVGDMLFMEK